MPLYEFKCQKCYTINEVLCKMGEKIIMCPQRFPTSIPGLLEKCGGSVTKIMSRFFFHQPWKWYLLSEDGMFYMEDPGEPVEYLYESDAEEEFYEGPDGYPDEAGVPRRFHDGIPWHRRGEWYRDNYRTPDDEEYWIKKHLDEESWDDEDEESWDDEGEDF